MFNLDLFNESSVAPPRGSPREMQLDPPLPRMAAVTAKRVVWIGSNEFALNKMMGVHPFFIYRPKHGGKARLS
jgi:hypothetical protein